MEDLLRWYPHVRGSQLCGVISIESLATTSCAYPTIDEHAVAKSMARRKAFHAVNYSLCKLVRNPNEMHNLGILIETNASAEMGANDCGNRSPFLFLGES